MKTFVPKATVLPALLLLYCWSAEAQPGPTTSVTSINFTYTANSTTPPKTTNTNPFTVTLPAAMSTQNLVVTTASYPQGWFSVTPAKGHSPLVLTVSVNPTTLDPGNHSGTIWIDTEGGSGNPAVVLVTIAISMAPPTLKVTNPAGGSLALAYTYITGDSLPSPAYFELDVASSGDVIPFNVTVANATSTGSSGGSKTPVWLRVNQSATSKVPANLTTSGVAISGSVIQIFFRIDDTVLATLDPISSPFNGVITITPTTTGSTASAIPPVTVPVSLQVLPGQPTIDSIFPSRIPASPTINPVITIYGKNFFSTTGVTIQQGADQPRAITGANFKCIDRSVIQITLASSLLTALGTWNLTVQNVNQPAFPITFEIIDPSLPEITSVVSAASYLPNAILILPAGVANTVEPGVTSVSPREMISIFGRNLGPTIPPPISPTGSPAAYPTSFPPATPVVVEFADASGASFTPPYYAPLIMVSSTQINCVVPQEVNGDVSPLTLKVFYNSNLAGLKVTAVAQDPGVFTFGGVGQGQAAILNVDSSSGAITVNSAKTQAPRNSAISIFVTGVGDFDPAGALANGAVAPPIPVLLAVDPTTVHVDIDGQPAVVTYAGTSPGAVAGLVQINAIVPLAAKVGATDSLTVSIGTAATSLRRSQPGVTVAVK